MNQLDAIVNLAPTGMIPTKARTPHVTLTTDEIVADVANYAKYLIDRGYLTGPFYANVLFGNVASAQATLLELGVVIGALPPGVIWSVGGIGDAQLPMNAISLAYGGGVRVGIEDNWWFD